MPNRLADSSSPYLRQHADNPVDWHPWGPEAFDIARRDDKPIFLSIGYAACHWCHVMAHESFESEAIAAVMNEHFVNIKVDREEQPDVDAVYMTAIQVMGQGGGWPLSAFCTPKGEPYYLGTYFPPEDKYGRPGFPRILRAMAGLYREDRDKVTHNADALLEGLHKIDEHYRKGAATGTIASLNAEAIVASGRWLVQRCDPTHGGFGGAPKFPSSSTHELLGRAGRLRMGEPAREAFLRQAMKMARGGIYDHVGGGFARYAVDEKWLIPHFEKMLYDNAQLLGIYGDAYAMTGEPTYARVIRETIVWLEREMLDPCGGLYASQDADSEGEEGKYYVWTPAQIEQVLGADDAAVFNRAYGVTEQGNFENATTQLSRVTPDGSAEQEAALEAMRVKLFAVRDARIHPGTDDKVLSAWNALMVTGLVRAWEGTDYAPALALATKVATFLADTMMHGTADAARLWRVYKDGVTTLDGTIDDYAYAAEAFFALAEATGERAWWDRGAQLMAAVIDRFYTDDANETGAAVFYMTPHDADETLVHRPESHHDGALPAGSSVAVANLVRLGMMCGDIRALEIAERYLGQRTVELSPHAASRLLAASDLYLHGKEIVVTEGVGRDALLAAARAVYAPTRMIAGPWAAESVLAGKGADSDGHAQAFVCKGQSCSAPVTEPDELRELLAHV